jgi:hypothetical protein
MPDTSHIHVRPLEIGDFDFVRKLASIQPNFTIPPVYVLWLMLRIKGGICLIAEHSEQGSLAYLLAVPVEGPGNSIFIWQVGGTTGRQGTKATRALLTEFRETVFARGIDTISFSSLPNSAVFRLIRRYAWDLAALIPKTVSALPSAVSDKESEFLLNLSGVHPDRSSHKPSRG